MCLCDILIDMTYVDLNETFFVSAFAMTQLLIYNIIPL